MYTKDAPYFELAPKSMSIGETQSQGGLGLVTRCNYICRAEFLENTG